MTLVKFVSLVLAAIIMGFGVFGPSVWPEIFQKIIAYLVGLVTLVFTYAEIPLYPAALPESPLVVGVGLLVLSIIPPMSGVLESRYRANGQAIYSTGVIPGTQSRFPGHLTTNLLGAVAAWGLVWTAHSTEGFRGFVADFSNEAAFNITLPLTTLVIFAFVRWQQVSTCADVDARARRDEIDWEEQICGVSLRHVHQLTNVTYLIAVTFTVATTILYLFAYTMMQAKSGHPLGVSWQIAVTLVASLGFLYACGSPWSRDYRAVFMTFLTGTPAALCMVLVWLAMFRGGTARNALGVSIVGAGYLLYCVEAILGTRARGDRLQLHYFSASAMVVVLFVLLGALYLS